MIKTLLKIGLVIIIAAVIGTGIGKCTKDFTCAAATSDWKQCDTELMILNTTDETLVYNVDWIVTGLVNSNIALFVR